jgi:tRNA pseudouridine38-40 synthase
MITYRAMTRMKATVAYDGTSYYGWQIQGSHPTIQSTIEECLQQIARKPVRITGAGRTDSGVHACEQVAHFDWDHPLSPEKLIYGLNGLLPQEIRVLTLQEIEGDFHARFDAKAKTYVYRIDTRLVYNPFQYRFSLHYPFNLDKNALENCARLIEGEHDFVAFQASGADVVSTKRTIQSMEISWSASPQSLLNGLLTFRVTAGGFLRKMVRLLVGTMLEIASAKRPIGDLEMALETGEKKCVGVPAAARGLFLEKVFY